jgi:hypothetical protein
MLSETARKRSGPMGVPVKNLLGLICAILRRVVGVWVGSAGATAIGIATHGLRRAKESTGHPPRAAVRGEANE